MLGVCCGLPLLASVSGLSHINPTVNLAPRKKVKA